MTTPEAPSHNANGATAEAVTDDGVAKEESIITGSAVPYRAIFNDVDMKHFMDSTNKKEILSFVEALGKACCYNSSSAENSNNNINSTNSTTNTTRTTNSVYEDLPPAMISLHASLQEMERWVDDFPPITNEVDATIRFGNPSFRQWHTRLVERSPAIITAMIEARDSKITTNKNISNDEDNTDNTTASATIEQIVQKGKDAAAGINGSHSVDPSIAHVSCFLHDAFGHAIRLDYGTGHESSFLVFLLVLSKVKCLSHASGGGGGGTGDDPNNSNNNDTTALPSLKTLRAVALSIFDQYLKVTRRLQTDYRLEPAGSHGVWGLDDYHCLPFYFGACQLQSQNVELELKSPTCINDEHILMDYGDTYMYLACIRYIRQLKKGVPFFESSPMLYDISQSMTSWDKVSRGLLRLYQGEVLDKRVVVQHFLFSKYFPATWTPSQTQPKQAPTETFRSQNRQQGGAMPPTRAPWADGAGAMPPTRAPWADGAGAMPPTRAPWADGSDVIPTRAPWAKDPK